MPAFGGDFDLAGLPVPADQPELFQDDGQRVPLMPVSQRLDAALGQQATVIGVTEVGALEHALHLLVSHQVSDGVDARIAPVAFVGHGYGALCRVMPGRWSGNLRLVCG